MSSRPNDIIDESQKDDQNFNTNDITNTQTQLEKADDTKDSNVEKPYSIFTSSEKWTIVLITAVAGMFSPLTANIYFPAIPTLAAAFQKPVELINLTVTIYMVVQGISPMFWGTIADRWGRRPIFLACLLTLCLACVGLALCPTNAYWLLMLLRCLQAAGSASTIALGAGVIGDISTPAERGGFFGLYSMGPMVGPCIVSLRITVFFLALTTALQGPVIGGALADKLGWRSIFWFLCISTAVCFVFMLLFLPETLRSLVGDGSYTPSPLYRPLLPIIGRHSINKSNNITKPKPKPFQNPLRLFTYPDILLLLIFNGILYAVFYGITATISVLFEESYPFLSETDIGLCFLAIGGGMVVGGIVTGRALDRDYRAIQKSLMTGKRMEEGMEKGTEEDFPIERARLRTMPLYLAVYVVCTIGYGWAVQTRVNLAVPLILQIVIGYAMVSVMNTTQTLIVDLVPSQGSSVTACNNIVRCLLGAGLVAIIDIIIKALGVGWTYVLLGGVSACMAPCIWVGMWLGPRERRKRREGALGGGGLS